MKNFSRLIIISIFFLVGFFLFANKIQANCTDGILGTCQYTTQGCGYSYVSGHCSGPTNYKCCAPNCGQAGGNSCGVTISGQSCTSLGRTYDCNPCYTCTPSAPPPPPPPPSTPNCGTLCGQNGCDACACNSDPRSTAYTWTSLGQSSDCKSPACYCGKTGGGGGGGGDNSTKTCGQICGEHGSTDGSSGCYCSSNSSCPSPLVSYGKSKDCTTCCSWSSSIPACGGGGGGGGGVPPPPPPSCSCSGWVNGACGPAGACSPGYRRQTRTCSPSGCSLTSQCAPDVSCNPACTVTLNPSSLALVLNGQAGVLSTTISPPTNGGSVSKVDFNIVDTSVAAASPISVTTPPYNTNVTGKKLGTTSVTALVTLSPSGSCTSPSIPITVQVGPWFQTQGGDVHTQGSLTDKIPSTATDKNFSLDLNNYPGVVSQKDGINLGDGFSSKSTAGNWVASSEYKGKPYSTFDFFKKKYALQMTTDNFNGSLPGADGVYYSSGGETLNGDQGDWDLSGNRWLVILVDGDVNIPFNVVVGQGSFLAIASSGKITFGNNVRKAQGMFVANGTINTGSTDRAFEGQGVFAASGFGLNRDFGDARNETTPAETFLARPDFLMSSYKNKDENLWWFFQKWQELAP